MNLRLFFLLFLLLQLPVYGALMWITFDTHPLLFYCTEAMLVVDVAACLFFYRKVVVPVETLSNGMDLLKAQDWNVALRPLGQPEVDSLVDVFNKMMERMHSQRLSLQEQRHFLMLLVAEAPVGVIVKGFGGNERMVNPAAKDILDRHPDMATRLDTVPDGSESTFRLDDSHLFRCVRRHFIDDGVRCCFYLIENVAPMVAAAERTAYVKLIRLMAHEVNNSVAAMSTALGALETDDPDGLLDACRRRALALSDFIGRFAELVKTPEPRLIKVNSTAMVRSCAAFLESLCTQSGVEFYIRTNVGATIDADPAQIEQVLVNVVKNACESTGRGGRVEITVDGATITVTDNGPGISQEKAEQMASPFFTDKPSGQGIGLTFVREVLTRHGCNFSLATSADDGLTRFRFTFG